MTATPCQNPAPGDPKCRSTTYLGMGVAVQVAGLLAWAAAMTGLATLAGAATILCYRQALRESRKNPRT